MNDRFTFRIWSKERKKYEHPSYVEETSLFVLARLSEERYTIEQCTGLKDKNGNLIYEGDIIRLPWQAGWPDLIGVVKFNELYACFLLSKTITDKAEQSFWWNEGKEVIGNIHENPELLEDK